jgi:hypothetical protein
MVDSFITPDLIADLQTLLKDFMPDQVDIYRVTTVSSPGGSTDTLAVVGSAICRIEEYTRVAHLVAGGGGREDRPIMMLSCPVDTPLRASDQLVQTANVDGPVVDGPRFLLTDVIPLESYAVEQHAWLQIIAKEEL